MESAPKILHDNYPIDSNKYKILYDFNNTTVYYPSDITVIDLFEQQVENSPNNTAIVKEDNNITYSELNSLCNRFADYLYEKYRILEGDVVAVRLERSEFLIVSVLSILKLGAIYLPIDMNVPVNRIEYIKKDSQFKVIIEKELIESFIQENYSYSGNKRKLHNRSKNSCYIIYTSGTTGVPKGTVIEHHSLVNRLLWMQKQYSLTEKDTIIQKTNCSFDVSVWELLWWTIVGSKVFFLKDGYERDPEQIIKCIARHSISVIHFVPSMLSQFLDFAENSIHIKEELSSIKRVYTSGEILTSRVNKRFHKLLGDNKLVNLYGPTEATIDVTFFECKKDLDNIPIGKPIDNTRIYILDEHLRLVDIGVEGQIFLAGVGLAQGYLNQAELTKNAFIEDVFVPGERMYKTGDIGKWLPDGNIDYIGRNDDQVKIRGFRVELEEINHHLEQEKEIKFAYTLHVDEKLIVFLLLNRSFINHIDSSFEDSLRYQLSKSLPNYFIPHHFLQIEEIPFSASGKIDRKHLISIFKAQQQQINREDELELSSASKVMAEIWASVLHIPVRSIDPSRGFIEQGGDSLSMLKVVAMCKKKGYKITVKEFLLAPYLNFLEKTTADDNEKITNVSAAIKDEEAFTLSPIQQYFFEHNKKELNFIMHASYYIQKNYLLENIRKSLEDIVSDHDSFNLRFRKFRGRWQQQYEFTDKSYLLEEITDTENSNGLKYCIARATKCIDIEKGPMLYVAIFIEDNLPILFVASHHLVMDAVSWQILISELQSNYFSKNVK